MSIWKDWVTAALLGTERGPAPVLPLQLASCPVPADEPGRSFLAGAAMISLWRKAGASMAPPSSEAAPAPAETFPYLSRSCTGFLRRMLQGEHQKVLAEWLTVAVSKGCLLPPEYLPQLLNLAAKQRDLREWVMALGGERLRWLAKFNPAWSFATTPALDTIDFSDSAVVSQTFALWETGTRDERLASLRLVRSRDPAKAREMVQMVWATEPAEVRVALLHALLPNLSLQDEPWLEESVLADRSKEVRTNGADLLARLPDSRLVHRMTERADKLLAFKPGKLLSKPSILVELPPEPDAAAKRDGIGAGTLRTGKLGARAAALIDILSAVPPTHWQARFQVTPEALIFTLHKNEFGAAVAAGLALAAVRFGDQSWARAVLQSNIERQGIPDDANLIRLLPEGERIEFLIKLLQTEKSEAFGDPAGAVSRILLGFDTHWPDPLARAVIRRLEGLFSNGFGWRHRAIAEDFLCRIPLHMLPEAKRTFPADAEGIGPTVEFLDFRYESITAITEDHD